MNNLFHKDISKYINKNKILMNLIIFQVYSLLTFDKDYDEKITLNTKKFFF